MFFIFTQKVIDPFPAHIFPDITRPGYPYKASYFEYRLCHNFLAAKAGLYSNIPTVRVGSHVVSVRIHCTEKWRTSFHTDVLSKSK